MHLLIIFSVVQLFDCSINKKAIKKHTTQFKLNKQKCES